MTEYVKHQPVVTRSTEPGVWHVYCEACSYEASEYTYPCRSPIHAAVGSAWPDPLLYEASFRVGRKAPDTSRAVEPKIRQGTLQAQMLRVFQGSIRDGYTDDALEIVLDRSHQSVSATRNTLTRKGLLEDSGVRRVTRSGNDAIVWRLTEAGRRIRP